MAKAVNTTITNCGNEATINVTNKNAKNIAGITGYSENTTITNSYNVGDITGGARVAGITGEIKTYTSIENCYNTGSVLQQQTRINIFRWISRLWIWYHKQCINSKKQLYNRCGYGKNSKWCSL